MTDQSDAGSRGVKHVLQAYAETVRRCCDPLLVERIEGGGGVLAADQAANDGKPSTDKAVGKQPRNKGERVS
eukprot:1792643-Pyramimonas_sp.AAC.1